jgi:hypothetical protein
MKNRSECCKEKPNAYAAEIVVTLNDVPLEARKKAASEPIYITHL